MASKSNPDDLRRRKEELLQQATKTKDEATTLEAQATQIDREIAEAEQAQLAAKRADRDRLVGEWHEREEKLGMRILKQTKELADAIDELLKIQREMVTLNVARHWDIFMAVRAAIQHLALGVARVRPDLVGKGLLCKRPGFPND